LLVFALRQSTKRAAYSIGTQGGPSATGQGCLNISVCCFAPVGNIIRNEELAHDLIRVLDIESNRRMESVNAAEKEQGAA